MTIRRGECQTAESPTKDKDTRAGTAREGVEGEEGRGAGSEGVAGKDRRGSESSSVERIEERETRRDGRGDNAQEGGERKRDATEKDVKVKEAARRKTRTASTLMQTEVPHGPKLIDLGGDGDCGYRALGNASAAMVGKRDEEQLRTDAKKLGTA